RHRAASSVGNASRESAHGEPPAHHVNPTSSRTPRLRQECQVEFVGVM
ncbi:unnamed protein product, partial [Ascophyllum nodosum]